MATRQPSTSIVLRIERTLPHPREKVFAAWIDPARVSRWFAPSAEYTVVVDALDARAGGGYRVEMRHSSGRVSIVSGRYLEVTSPSRLRFTWQWEEGPEERETLVTVELKPKGTGTELTLTHELFLTEVSRDEHRKGWTGCLDLLEAALSR
jgi:uncharacterized protein YndB with AHSA1/START domain